MSELRIVVAHAIRAERARAGLSQRELADQLGWSRSVITKIETGSRTVGVHELPALCKALDTTIARLMMKADPRERHDMGL